jgi:gamma-D-glutamyl-L-lysine dipeptidyl-peptidase
MFVATNLTDLHREPSFLSEMLCQIFNGMSMTVLEEQEKWCHVRMEDGYEGWAHRPFLTDSPAPSATHITHKSPVIRSEPNPAAPTISRLSMGTRIYVEDSTDGWSLVRPAGEMIPLGWVTNGALRPLTTLPLSTPDARQQIVADARRFTGVYYLWGGNTAFGTDCSGLSWLMHRVAGYDIPRDSHPQFEAAKKVDPPFAPGDLLFFHKESDTARIGHVGISVGGWRMIHSSRSRNGVYEEDVQESEGLTKTFAGARSFLV